MIVSDLKFLVLEMKILAKHSRHKIIFKSQISVVCWAHSQKYIYIKVIYK